MMAPPAFARAVFAAFLLAGPAFAGLAGVSLPAGASESTRFVTGLGDVPVMPGLAPAEEEPLVFDKPDGRIAQSVMAGRVDRKAVLAFYNQTMPQLGWKRTSDTNYVREGEELRLEFVKTGRPVPPGQTTVRFTLSPR